MNTTEAKEKYGEGTVKFEKPEPPQMFTKDEVVELIIKFWNDTSLDSEESFNAWIDKNLEQHKQLKNRLSK